MDPAADPGEMLYMKFNTGWNSTAGINLSLDIFNPAAHRQTAEQKIQNSISNYDLQISENDLRTEVAKAYAACVISQDQVESFRDDTVFYSKSLAEAELLYNKNQISLTEKNNIVIAYNSSLMQYHNAENVLSEAKANLLYLLGEEVSSGNLASLHLSENIPALYRKMSPETNEFINNSQETGKGYDLSRQSEVIALVQSRVKSSKLKTAPSLSLKGFYGSNYYNNDFNPGNVDFWHGNSYMAVSLKIPLAQAFTLSRETSQFRLQENIERENLRDMQNRKSKDMIEAANKLTISVKEYELTGKNYELSVQNLDASRARLDKEYLQEKDFLEEQVKCRNTYQKFLEAAYNVFINTIELRKLESE
jgi:outer membrane protein TolC